MTFYNHIESVRGLAIDLTNGRKWRGASDKAAVFDALDAARREYMRLSDENAKLRELVQILVHCLNGVDCDECPLNGNPYEVRGEWAACDALRDRMGELGVEVNG